ncbi:hypothetical protein J2X65_003560 [Ancylobacter sp. 3268]|uniref:hypothetical protein n=1 Tax=Ancylobacter sp. 3268 TaxID=2817752 RepID=UPI00285826D5|nr:hypothetical protein [Ancylobacter sp. 3268]MDR6954192.1 hypothetical protein [Ancylobacter sp. 3268]
MMTNDEKEAVGAFFERVKVETDRRLAASKQRGVPPQMAKVAAAQNALRGCMEVVFDHCLPYDQLFVMEMAIRLASYAISSAPIEAHKKMCELVAEALPGALERRVREGIAMHTQWGTGPGDASPNIPSKGDIQ